MRRELLTFLLFIIGGTLFLMPSFHHNQWKIVESEYYRLWQRTYERVVVARLAKSQQDGIFSAGGLLGLANSPQGWNFDLDTQYDIYQTKTKVEYYLPYKSHPGLQGIVFSVIDRITNLSPQQNIALIRTITAVLSAFAISLLSAFLAVEFGWLSAVLVLLFSAFSEWMILPAVNAYWNLWAFYLPFLTAIILLVNAAKRDNFPALKIYLVLFAALLIKILFTGFEMITTVVVMVTVPFVYFAMTGKWKWQTILERFFKLGLSLVTATLVGILILLIQIAANDASLTSSLEYITNTIGRRSALNVGRQYSLKSYQDSKEVSVSEVLLIYLKTNAFNSQTQPEFWQVSYSTLITIFWIVTLLFLIKYRSWKRGNTPSKGLALVVATWYSILAPLSWIVIFKPTAYIHTFLFPMAWQMPFTLLGLALCGYVITDLFKQKPA
jgi:hypothetical protein